MHSEKEILSLLWGRNLSPEFEPMTRPKINITAHPKIFVRRSQREQQRTKRQDPNEIELLEDIQEL